MADEWDVTKPINHTLVSALPEEIRKLKASAKTQIDREHETPVDGDVTGGEHSNGSAVAYRDTATPSNRPDGSTALASNNVDKGRLWIDDNLTQVPIKRWNGSAWVTVGMSPSAMSAVQSVILANGLILKFGSVGFAASQAISFGAAFPTGVISAKVTIGHSGTASVLTPIISALSTSGMTIISGGAGTTYYWEAVGY